MASQTFTRASTFPDLATLYPAVSAAIGSQFMLVLDYRDDGSKPVQIDKATPWLPAEIAAVQTAVTAAASSPVGQTQVDNLPIWAKALALALIDQLNVIRADLTTLGITRPAITVNQAIGAIRTKAGTL